MTKQEAINKFRNEFTELIEKSKKNPKTHCHFAERIAGKEQYVPCFMLDTIIALLCKVEDIIGGIDE